MMAVLFEGAASLVSADAGETFFELVALFMVASFVCHLSLLIGDTVPLLVFCRDLFKEVRCDGKRFRRGWDAQ